MEPRHPYFVRNPKGSLVLQERDCSILDLVYEHRFLDTRTLALLLGHQGSEWALQSRLQKLFHHAFLDRPPRQLALKVTGEEPYLIYGLGRRGAQLLSDRYGLSMEPNRWTQKNNEVADIHLQHVLGLNRFRAALTLAIPSSAPHEGTADHSQTYLLPWRQGEILKAKIEIQTKSGRKESWSLTPDAFFGIQKPKQPPNRSYFFVEYQRTTPNAQRFVLAKGIAYLAYRKQGSHEKQLRIKDFRVLVIAQTESKQDTLRRYIREWLAKQKSPSWNRWLFTCEQHYSLERPETILGPIWKPSNDECLISLLD